ncbi:MAG: hypothetical protein U0T82_01640 [Bacteroidales bacterium]
MKNLLLWTPRILAILFILFISMFAADAFEGDAPLGRKLLGFLIHLLPTVLLLISLVIAWKYPHIGGVLFILAALFFTIWFSTYNVLTTFLLISLPPALIGLIFLWQWKKK